MTFLVMRFMELELRFIVIQNINLKLQGLLSQINITCNMPYEKVLLAMHEYLFIRNENSVLRFASPVPAQWIYRSACRQSFCKLNQRWLVVVAGYLEVGCLGATLLSFLRLFRILLHSSSGPALYSKIKRFFPKRPILVASLISKTLAR